MFRELKTFLLKRSRRNFSLISHYCAMYCVGTWIDVSYLSIFLILVSAKRTEKKDDDSTSESISEEDNHAVLLNHNPTSLDISGNLRKYFSLEAALVDPNMNMVCSPLSALLPLAKLALGATKKSEKELLSAIGLKKTSQISTSFKKIISGLEHLPGVRLDIASRFYVNTNVEIRSSYKRRVSKIFKSTIENIRMSSPKYAAGEINDWVSKQTRGMIPTIIKPDDLSSGTVMVLVNAIFFVGFWKSPFGILKTDNFYTSNGIHRIPMMSQVGKFNYWQDDVLNAQIIELPYVGEDSSFILVLPMNKDGLPMLLKQLKLAPKLLPQALDNMKLMSVNLTMPKFKIETELNLKTLYQKIGLYNMFKTKSSLTRIVKGDPIYVTQAVQKAVIEVNEMGTKASAASGIKFEYMMAFKNVQFSADRPFFFFIKTKNEQLFAGTFVSPTNENIIE